MNESIFHFRLAISNLGSVAVFRQNAAAVSLKEHGALTRPRYKGIEI